VSTIETLTAWNAAFAAESSAPSATLLPTLRTVIIGCVDPRVDPAQIQTMALLRMIGEVEGGAPADSWNVVVLHHTDCIVVPPVRLREGASA
jgi:carbonic anhydrase